MTEPREPGTEVAESPAAGMLAVIERVAANPDVDPAKMMALLELQERMMARQAEIEFNRALASLPPLHVKKNGRVELGGGKGYAFAKWEDMSRVIEPLLQEAGFRLMFDGAAKEGGGLLVSGTLLHRDGHSRTASIPLALDTGQARNNLQSMGSTLSYGKRYVSEMLLNIVRDGDDDDGVRGGDEPISDQQVAELSRMMTEASFAERSMYDLLGVTALTEIKKSQLAIARNAIGMRQRQRGKA